MNNNMNANTDTDNNANSIIQEITMDCLMSREQKQKLKEYSIKQSYNKKDKKFYRRRILNLTREMLLNNYNDDTLPDVKFAFENYVKTCIGYFKIKDEVDILQEEYIDNILDDATNDKLDIDDIVSPEEADKLMMRSIKINKLPLDNFVKIKYMKPEKEMIIPKQKEINLKDPILKKKGIREKNNIHNSYKDDKESKKEDPIQKEIQSNKAQTQSQSNKTPVTKNKKNTDQDAS